MILNSHFTKVKEAKLKGTRGFSSARSTPLLKQEDSDMNEYLFVLVTWKDHSRCFTSIIQLETTPQAGFYDPKEDAPLFDSEISLSFQLPEEEPLPKGPVQWGYSLLLPSHSRTSPSPTEEEAGALLHMVPDWTRARRSPEADTPLNSLIFNLKTKELKRIRSPHGVHKEGGHVVTDPSLGRHTYFIAPPNDYFEPPPPAFERYDPLKDEWKELEPIPQEAIDATPYCAGRIEATAVWVHDGTILFNVSGNQMWAYNVDKNKWYPVECPTDWYSIIVGEAIVLGNTIYGLSQMYSDNVVALSIEKIEVGRNDDPVYKCSLSEIISMPKGIDIEFEYEPEAHFSRHLVHLGGFNFCLVYSQSVYGPGDKETYQHIQLTNMKLNGGKSMTVTNKCIHRFKLEPYMQFRVTQCFSLPRNKTTDLKRGETLFNFNPYPEGFLSALEAECESKFFYRGPVRVILPKDVQELDANSNVASKATSAYEKADDEGHPFCVVKFSSYATVGELVEELEVFGSIRRCDIQVTTDKMGKRCAYVEFESKTSKRHAIEASPIEIGGRRAVIQKLGRNVDVFVTSVGDLLERAAELAAALAPLQPVSDQAASCGGYGRGGDIVGRGDGEMAKFYKILQKLRPESSATSSLKSTLLGKRSEVNSHHMSNCNGF